MSASWFARFIFPLKIKWESFRQRWYWADQGHLMPRPGMVEEFKQPQYSPASRPMPWSEDIARHNGEVSRAYKEEVRSRQQAFVAGTYTPRFLLCDPLMKQANSPGITIEDVNWDLEMTLRPGARVEVTGTAPQLRLVTPEERADIRVEMMAHRAVMEAQEKGKLNLPLPSPRMVVGTRAAILEVCGGNEFLADQVEQQAREFFGVEDLDAPLKRIGDASQVESATAPDGGGEPRRDVPQGA